MTKSHVRHFLGSYSALIQDIIAVYPDLRLDLERDYTRIKSSSAQVGIRVFTEFLPDIGKVLYRSLSDKRLVRHSIPFMRVRRRNSPIPRLFQGIWLRLFEYDGVLKHDIDPNLLFFFSTLLQCGKKFDMEAPESALFAQTGEFYVTDESLPRPSLSWDGLSSGDFDPSGLSVNDVLSTEPDLFRPSDGTTFIRVLDTIQRTADIVSGNIGLVEPDSFRHGPGAVAERQRGIEKFSFHRWSARLEEQFPIYGNALPLSGETPYEEGETHSRLLAVPKTIKGPRLIAAEPTDHMWAQFSIMDKLVHRVHKGVLRNSITFDSQEPSRKAALDASTGNGMATIDLKSASDRISLWLVERIFRKNPPLLDLFRACRTSFIDLSIDKKLPSLHRLKKFTTQGSALTFPVQSIIFATICIGVGLHKANLRPTCRNVMRIGRKVRVFGDDIIIPEDWVETTISALTRLGLKVNLDKTHFTGRFRESCGIDAYDGCDITPAYIRRFGGPHVSGVTSVVDCSNNFFTKGLWHTAQMIASTLPKTVGKNIPVRKTSDTSIAFTSFSGDFDHPRIKRRWNDDYQRFEIRVFTAKPRVSALKADGSLLLRAFLALREYQEYEPSFEGLDPWRPLSRWEARPREGMGWVAA